MANLRDLAPGLGGQFHDLAPGLAPRQAASLPVNYAPDAAPMLRESEMAGMSQTGRGYRSTRLLNDANYLANEEAVRRAAGDVAGADTLRSQIAGLQREAAQWAPREQDITQIGLTQPGRLLDYAAGAVGSMAASAQDPMAVGAGLRGATALAGLSKNPVAQAISKSGNAITAAGTFVPNFMANAGETYNEQAADERLVATRTPMERALAAGGAGLAMGALDTLPHMGVLGRVAGPANVVNKAMGPGGILTKAGKDSLFEGATEVAQTGVQKGVHTLMNGQRDTSGDFADYANAFAQGTIGSAPMNAAANSIEAMRSRVQEPGDPGIGRGDEVDLKTGKVVGKGGGGEGVSLKAKPDFEEDLKARSTPEWATSEEAIKSRMSMIDGLDDFVDTPERRDAIVEELTKVGDAKSAELAARLTAANFDDPVAALEHAELMDEAADHVRPLAGLDADSINRLINSVNGRKKSERLFAPQDHIDLKGEAATTAKNVSGLMAGMMPEEIKAHPGATKFLAGIGRELVSMSAIEAETVGKDGTVQPGRAPSEGELQRAARLGTIVGSMLRDNTEATIKQLAQAAGAQDSKLFSTFAEHAQLHSGKATVDTTLKTKAHRTDTADRVLGLVPQAKINELQGKGINIFDDNVKDHLLDGLQAMFDGDESMLSMDRAVSMFGKRAVAKMEKLLGVRIGAEQMIAGGTETSMGSDESVDDVSEFDKAQAEKAALKAPSDSIIYGRGSQGKGIPLADILNGRGRKNKLPSFIDTRHKLAQKERDKLMAEYEATAGQGPATVARFAKLSALTRDMPRAQRESLMLRAIEEDFSPKEGDNVVTADDRKREDPTYRAKRDASAKAKGLRALRDVDRVISEMYANWRPRSVKAVSDALAASAEVMPEAVYQEATAAMRAPNRREAVRVVHKMIRAAIRDDTADLQRLVSAAAGTRWTEGGDPAHDYFEHKEVLVVEKADATAEKDADVMTQQEFRGLVEKAKPALDKARQLQNEDAANELLWKEGMLYFPANEGGGEGVPIKAKHIVAWARNAEFSSTTMTDSAKRKAAVQNKQDNFLSMLAQGMAEMLRQGYVTGLPVVIDAQGNAEAFTQPRSRKEVNADRRAELAANGPDEARAINRKFDAELRLGGIPASLMLDDGRTAEQFVMSPKFSIAAEVNNDPLLGSAYDAARSGSGDAERVAKSIADARRRSTEREAALRDARNKVSDKVSLEQAAADKFPARNDETAPIYEDGFYFGNPAEDGTKADADAQETAMRDAAVQGATEFAGTKYGRYDAVTKAKQVGKELWQQWVMTPTKGLARIKAIAKDLSDKRYWHAAPLAALVVEARARSEKLAPKDIALMKSLISKVAGVVLRNMEPSADRTKIVSALAGTTFDDAGAENTWLAKTARHYAEVEAKRHEAAEAAKEAARLAAAEPAPKATPGKNMLPALKASINERKAKRLEAELSVAQEELTAVLREVAPMTAKIKAVSDLVSRINSSLDEKTPFPGLFVQRGQLERLLTEARNGLAAAGRAAIREHRADMDRLAQVASEIARSTRELDAMEKRNPVPTVAMGRIDSLGADGVPKIPGDKGPRTTPAQRRAARLAAAVEPERKMVTRKEKPAPTANGGARVATESTPEAAGMEGRKLSQRDSAKTASERKNTSTQPAPSDADLERVRAVIGRLLGPNIKVAFEKTFDAAGEWVEADKTVRIALQGVGPMLSTAYHEGLHGFFSQVLSKNNDVKEMLYRAVNDPRVDRQLRALLAGETAALAALDANPEERVAYTFELWATKLLDLPAPEAKTFFDKVQRFFRSVLGLVSEQDKALEIFTALYDGKMAEPSAAQRAVERVMSRGEGVAAARMKRDKEVEFFKSMVLSAGKTMRDSESKTAQQIGRMFHTNPGSTAAGAEPAYMNLRRTKVNQAMGQFSQIVQGLSAAELKHMAKLDNEKVDPEMLPEGPVKTALKRLYKFNARFYTYLRESGLELGVRDDGRYTPMVWDLEYMIPNKDKFVNMLVEHYPHVLRAARAQALVVDPEATSLEDVAGMMHQTLVDRGGVDTKLDAQREDGVLSPYFASKEGRSFDWIAPEHRAEFLSTDLVAKMTSYIHQGARSAEYTRMFGERGEKLSVMLMRAGDVIGRNRDGLVTATEDGPVMKELREAAATAKVPADKVEDWVQRRHEDIRRAAGAMEGTLGKDITDRVRKINSTAMVYQNLRLLPLSIFAAMLDPNGIMVSGGTLNDGLRAYARGMKKVLSTWKALATGGDISIDGDDEERAAMIVGAVDSTVFLERMGEARTSEYIGGTARKVNNKFFLANGLTMWDRSMRIAATGAAMRFIKRHAAGEDAVHSKRWLSDLGLTADDVALGADGKVVVDRNQLARQRAELVAGWAGMTPAQKADQVANMLPKATKDVAKMHAAINRFVERSILSPNAAQRPTWASDPHYAALFHLKQYTYSFHETIMQHVAEEAGHGNYKAGLQMLMGIPIMIAADITKGLVTGGGSLPGYMANWNMGDWLMHAWGRAGLNGIGQIGLDAWGDPTSVLGPSVDQLADTIMDPASKFGDLDMVPGLRYTRPELDKLVGL